MKTRELRYFHSRISEINNVLAHYSFIWAQFGLDYLDQNKLAINGKHFTSDFFPQNPERFNYNVRLEDLESEYRNANNSILEGVFVFEFTLFENFLKELSKFCKEFEPQTQILDPLQNREVAYQDKLLKNLNISDNDIDKDVYYTMDLIRLKRNRLTHSSSKHISQSIRNLIKSQGKKLDKYWEDTLGHKNIGFRFAEVEEFDNLNIRIAVELFHILRIIARMIDEVVTEKLGHQNIIEKILIPEFLGIKSNKLKNLSESRIEKQFIKYCTVEFGVVPNSLTLEKLHIQKDSIA